MVHLVAFLGEMVTVLPLVLWKSAKEQVTLLVPGKHPGDPSLALVTGQVLDQSRREFGRLGGQRKSSCTSFTWSVFLGLLRNVPAVPQRNMGELVQNLTLSPRCPVLGGEHLRDFVIPFPSLVYGQLVLENGSDSLWSCDQ